MSLFDVFNVAGSAMNAQSVRMNTSASNLANAGSVSGDPNNVYRAGIPCSRPSAVTLADQSGASGVRLDGIVESRRRSNCATSPTTPRRTRRQRLRTNVNTVEEMVNMMSASRSYKNNVEMINTTKDLLLQT